MPSVNTRLERLEQHAGNEFHAGPSLIVLTALGRSDEEVRAIRLSGGVQLNRGDGEGAAAFRARASRCAAGIGAAPTKLATAIYDLEEDKEACR